MKKINLLLFLICILFQTISVTAGSTVEKINLSPKIKKGDSWKMVVDIGGVDYKWNFDSTKSTLPGLFKNLMSSQNSNLKFRWDVNCVESTKESLVLHFVLENYVVENRMISNDLDYLVYNDTDYPLTLNQEDISMMKDVLGKSVVLEIPWNSDSAITYIRNDFKEEKRYSFPAFTFQNKKEAKNYSVQFGSFKYAGLAVDLLNILMTQWQGMVPKSPVKIGDKWSSEFQLLNDPAKEMQVNLNFQLSGIDKDYAFVEVVSSEGKEKAMINRETGWFSILGNNSSIRTFSYNFSKPNTHLEVDFESDELDGEALFEVMYPAGHKTQKVKVKNGKFKLDLDLKEPVLAKIRFKKRQSTIFLRPLMDVNVTWNNGKIQATGYGSEDINCVVQAFSEYYYLDHSTNDYPKEKIVKEIHDLRSRIDSIVNGFGPTISLDCKNYISTETEFKVASSFVSALDRISLEEHTTFPAYKPNDLNRLHENKNYFRKYLDTVQINGSLSLCAESYHQFIKDYLELEESEFLTQRGRRYDEDKFAENILFAGIQYVGYPYFYSVYDLLKSEILKGNASLVERELDDFYNLPGGEELKSSLKTEIAEMEPLTPGRLFPLSEIVDVDGEAQKLPTGELCIVDLDASFNSQQPQHKFESEELTRIIAKDDRISKINYVVIRPYFAKGRMVETPDNDTVNFTHIYLPAEDITTLNSLKLIDGRSRILLLDKDLKIINNNIGRITYYSGHHLEEIINRYFELKNQPKLKADTRRLLIIILISLVCFGFLSWFVIRLRTQKISKREAAKRKLSELELRAIRSQMNPHFMFNALNSIQNLVNKNKIEASNIYLSEFAEMMRLVLNNSEKQLVPLEEEIKLIQSYLELEKLRIPFEFEILMAPDIHPEEEEIPGMLIQPFVENAVIHGIAPQKGGEIKVAFTKTDHKICCEIIDNGMGISKRSKQRNGNGKAIKMMEERIKIVNAQTTEKLTFEIIDRNEMNEKGTLVRIEIPV
ncbi:MAG: histidine kinase [Draconibacterium sp.]